MAAIIAVLASLLLPALQSARRRAQRANCAGNLHQLGVALQLYVQDARAYPTATDGDGLGNWQRALRPNAAQKVLQCPQLVKASDEFLQYFPDDAEIFPHFGYNSTGAIRRNPPLRNLGLGGDFVWTGTSGHYVAAKENTVRRPSQLIVFGDSPTFVRPPFAATATLTPADPIYIAFPFILQPSGYYGVGKSHQDGANMIFCDGHTQFAKQAIWMQDTEPAKSLWNIDNQPHPEVW